MSHQSFRVFFFKFKERRRILYSLFNLADMLSRRNILGHNAANTLYCLTDFFTNCFMGPDGMLLVIHPVTRQFVPCLGHTKLVRCELSGVHSIHYIFSLGYTLACLNPLSAESAVQTLVTGIMKDAKHPILHACFTGSTRKGLKLLRCLLANFQSLYIGGKGV